MEVGMGRWGRWGAGRTASARRGRGLVVTVLALCLVAVVVCSGATARGQDGRASAASYYRLVQYPGAGYDGMYQQIGQARRSIDMEIYELADPIAEHDLVLAADRGVHVRVLLDKDFNGGEVNGAAFRYLTAQGVDVKWAPAGYLF